MRKLKKEQKELLQQHEDGENTQGGVLISLQHLNFQRLALARTSEQTEIHSPSIAFSPMQLIHL